MNQIEAKVLATRMVMTVALPDGTEVQVTGNAPVGSTISLQADDIRPEGSVVGYQGYRMVRRQGRTVHPLGYVMEKLEVRREHAS